MVLGCPLGVEAEDGVKTDVPLLCDDDDDHNDVDGAIVAQLISTNERSGRPRRCIEKFGRDRCGRASSLALVLLSWAGLLASGWSAFSCDLVAVRYPAGGVRLTVEAVGIWGYRKAGAPGDPGGGEGGGAAACVGYGATLAKQPELKNILPSSRMLQICSVLATSFYFAAFLAVVIFASISSAHPGVIDQSEAVRIGGMKIAATAAACSFPTAAIIHIVSLHGLIHYNDDSVNNDQSPICNPTYSSCYLGPGGRWAVFAIVGAFFCGINSLLAAYYVVCKAGRNAGFCWR